MKDEKKYEILPGVETPDIETINEAASDFTISDVGAVNIKSSVVFLSLLRPSSLYILSSISVPFLTWHAVPSHTLMTYLPFWSKEKFS